MSSHRKRKRHASGGGPSPADQEARAIESLRPIAAELGGSDGADAGRVWGEAHKVLLKTSADKHEIMGIVARRDVAALTALIEALSTGETTPAPDGDAPADGETTPTYDVPPETLKKAMRAFRKRLKLTRLDEESRISVSPMSSGRKSTIKGILPPHEYPREVWNALVAKGFLRNESQGFYSLAEE